jgi:hypothetical protein
MLKTVSIVAEIPEVLYRQMQEAIANNPHTSQDVLVMQGISRVVNLYLEQQSNGTL